MHFSHPWAEHLLSETLMTCVVMGTCLLVTTQIRSKRKLPIFIGNYIGRSSSHLLGSVLGWQGALAGQHEYQCHPHVPQWHKKQQWLRPALLVHWLGMTGLLAFEGAGQAQKFVEAWMCLLYNNIRMFGLRW